MMNKMQTYLMTENDRLKSENACLTKDVRDLCEQIGYLRGYISGREDIVPKEYSIELDDLEDVV